MKILAIVLARGGSKGLKDKNILPLLGNPLIAYSIKAALDSRLINRVIVSTDSEKIADIARNYGAEVPFMRPAKFAKDLSTDMEVFTHALGWLEKNEDYIPDVIVQLRPTSPLRFLEDMDLCIEDFIASGADSLRSVTPAPCTPYKMWTINEDNRLMKPLLTLKDVKEAYNEPRQRLPKVFLHVGVLDLIKTSTIKDKKSLTGKKILSYIIPNEFCTDIDDLDDFHKAEELVANSSCIKFD